MPTIFITANWFRKKIRQITFNFINVMYLFYEEVQLYREKTFLVVTFFPPYRSIFL